MDHQTTLNGHRPRHSPQPTIARDAAEIARDVATLVELQFQLLAADLRKVRGGTITAMAVWLVAAGLLVAALPTAVAGCGLFLAQMLAISVAVGLLGAALTAIAVGVILAWAGWRVLRNQLDGLARSREEMARNAQLLKRVLSNRPSAGNDPPYQA